MALQPGGGSKQKAPIHRILVLDDNPDAADMLAVLLSLAGYEVCTAYTGPEAIRTAEHFRPDVAFLDIGLPGMDGHEVARRLRALPGLGDILLVAVTGYGQEHYRKRSQEAGCDYHFVKPVDPDVLESVMRSRAES